MYYIGLDVHKKTISYCVKDAAGRVHMEGKIGSTRRELDAWIKTLPQPRTIAMEATIFTGWIYDHLLPHAEKVKVAHPLMLRAIAAAKRKNDRIDASKIADCLRCDFLPECHMASTEIRDRRRTLRYREPAGQADGADEEPGIGAADGNRGELQQAAAAQGGLLRRADVGQRRDRCQSIRPLLKLSREHIVRAQKLDYALVSSLERDPLLVERLRRLRTVPGVGPITALTWALEIGDVSRFRSIKQAISYCGLCGAEKSSADKVMRTPISKQRNKHIQHVLVEAAKLAPRLVPRTGPAPRKGDAEGQSQSGHAGRGQEDGLLDARGGTQKTGLRACRKVHRHGGSVKTFLRRKKHQDHSMRRLPGPASRPLGEGDQTPEALLELFRDWQRTQTQSSATALRSLEAANGCPVLLESRNHTAERPRA